MCVLLLLLYSENPVIVAGFYVGFADEQKTNKKSAKNVLVSKAPLCKGRLGLSPAQAGLRNNCMAGMPIHDALVRSQ